MEKENINYEDRFEKHKTDLLPGLEEKFQKALADKSKDVRELERLKSRNLLTEDETKAKLSSSRHSQTYLAISKYLAGCVTKMNLGKNITSNEDYLTLTATAMEQMAKELRGLAATASQRKK